MTFPRPVIEGALQQMSLPVPAALAAKKATQEMTFPRSVIEGAAQEMVLPVPTGKAVAQYMTFPRLSFGKVVQPPPLRKQIPWMRRSGGGSPRRPRASH